MTEMTPRSNGQTDPSIAALKTEAAARMGLAENRISTAQMEIRLLREHGTLIDIDVAGI